MLRSVKQPIVPVLAAALWSLVAAPCSAQFGPAPVVLEAVREELVAPSILLPGTAASVRHASVAAAEEGLVVERLASFGQLVKKGELLLRLDPARAEARLAAARADEQAALARSERLVTGERAEKIASQRASLARCEASLEDARTSRDRALEVFRRGAGTPSERDQAEARFKECRAQVESARSELELLVSGSRKEDLAEAKAAHERAKAQTLEAAKVLQDLEVRAPFDGQAGEPKVEVGDWVARGAPVLELFDNSEMDVVVLVPEVRIGEVLLREPAAVTFRTAGAERVVEGVVAASSPEATAKGRMVPVEVRIANPGGLVRSGMSCEVRLPVGKTEKRLVVPKDAVVRGADGSSMVYGVAEGKAVPHPVTLGQDSGGKIVVLSGLAAGTQVVVRGNERLRPGAPVSTGGAGPASPPGSPSGGPAKGEAP